MSPPHVPKVVFFSVSVTLLSALSSSNLRLGLWAFSCVEGGRVQVVMPCLPQMLAVLAMDWGGGIGPGDGSGCASFFLDEPRRPSALVWFAVLPSSLVESHVHIKVLYWCEARRRSKCGLVATLNIGKSEQATPNSVSAWEFACCIMFLLLALLFSTAVLYLVPVQADKGVFSFRMATCTWCWRIIFIYF